MAFMLISTSYSPSEKLRESAQTLAYGLRARWVPRRHHTINELREKYGNQPILLVTEQGLRLYGNGDKPVFFHPSMAILRIQGLARGETDVLVEVTGAEAGDTVLDCTAGLASDAIVLSYVTGESGKVTALESETPLYVLVREGLSHYHSDVPGLNDAMRRICLKHADHLEYLKSLPDRSVDIVYFDPMFRRPVEESAAISPIRDLANPRPISKETIREAVRVARKTVVLKEHRDSGEFVRLGFERFVRSHSKIAYGVIRL